MSKPLTRSYSRYSREAASLLGQLIRRARTQRHMTVEELAERAGLSRGLIHRIERGDLGCSIGAAFEAAAIVGVHLFDAEPAELTRELSSNAASLALLPKRVRASLRPVKDDF